MKRNEVEDYVLGVINKPGEMWNSTIGMVAASIFAVAQSINNVSVSLDKIRYAIEERNGIEKRNR